MKRFLKKRVMEFFFLALFFFLTVSFINCQKSSLTTLSYQPEMASSVNPQDNDNGSPTPPVAGVDPWWSVIPAGTSTSGSAVGKYPGYTYNLSQTRPFISLKDLDQARNAVSGTKNNSYLLAAAKRLKAQCDLIVPLILAFNPVAYSVKNENFDSQLYYYVRDYKTKSPSDPQPYWYFDFSATDLIYTYYAFKDYTNYASGEPTAQDYLKAAIKMNDLYINSEFDRISRGEAPDIQLGWSLYFGDKLEPISLAFDHGYDLLTADQKAKWSAYAEQSLQAFWSGILGSWDSTTKTYSGFIQEKYANHWCYQNNWRSPSSSSTDTQSYCKDIVSNRVAWAVNAPGNNYFYSFIFATQTWALASHNAFWFQYLQNYLFPLVVNYFSQYEGGGSREGTSYGDSLRHMYTGFRYWRNSTGEDLSLLTSHTKETLRYWLHATSPDLKKYSPFGDHARDANPYIFDYQRHLFLELVNLNANTDLAKRGNWWLKNIDLGAGPDRFVYLYSDRHDLIRRIDIPELNPSDSSNPFETSYYSQFNGILSARSSWASNSSWFVAIAGVMDESHAHQEQGSIMFYKSGWLTVPSTIHSGLFGRTDDKNVVRFTSPDGKSVMQYGKDYEYMPTPSQLNYVDSGDIIKGSLKMHKDLYLNPAPYRAGTSYVGD